MDYLSMQSKVLSMEGVQNMEQADEAIRDVLGHFLVHAEEKVGKMVAEKLPAPLTYDSLLDHHPEKPSPMSLAKYVRLLGGKQQTSNAKAENIVKAVVTMVMECIGDEDVYEIERMLPEDWAALTVKE